MKTDYRTHLMNYVITEYKELYDLDITAIDFSDMSIEQIKNEADLLKVDTL